MVKIAPALLKQRGGKWRLGRRASSEDSELIPEQHESQTRRVGHAVGLLTYSDPVRRPPVDVNLLSSQPQEPLGT